MMDEYPKIQSVFKRNETTHKFITGMWSLPEFEYLQDNIWCWTEKIDGTNIRVLWTPPETITFGGRTDRAQIPVFLLEKLQEIFTVGRLWSAFPETEVTFYGEGYGARIQKGGGNYISNGVDFILFDVKISGWWLEYDDVMEIAKGLNVRVVPIHLFGNIHKAVELVQAGLQSQFGTFTAEGLVGKPLVALQSRSGHRIITKLKSKDFE